ncbi:MAG: putative toxin-antitoxin system toxin component, PIN family [Betaproteobacteria bacterium]|nr:putative toxin-antitoxin system toxin component, PIN family [Betaproteobacteria bacterium]
MPRIALDTDVLVAALLGAGAANRLLAAVLEGRFEPLMSPALYAEHEAVLGRSARFARCRLSAAEREELFDIYAASCRWTRIYFLWRPNLRDESDNHLVELAVAGGAQAIVTRNKRDFRGAELKFENLAVLTPAECLRRKTWLP